MYAEAEKELTELREGRERNLKIMENLRHQRDMYKEIAARATAAEGDLSTLSTSATAAGSAPSTPNVGHARRHLGSPVVGGSPVGRGGAATDAERRELEARLSAAEASAAAVKKEYDVFREEHKVNVNMLMEENAKLRESVDQLR
jgi:hypothetical protein